MTDPNSPAPVRDYGTSLLRTWVPVAWGALITFLLSRVPDLHAALTGPGVTMAVTGVVVGLWYAVWRKLEHHIPPFLTALLLGSNSTPTYVEGTVTKVTDVPYRR